MREDSTEGDTLICQYIETALARAHYDLIDDEEPFYGEVPELQGVWATGQTLEECRGRLAEVIEGWVLVRLARGLTVPPLGDVAIVLPTEMPLA